jgi:hypothetical protein
LSGENIFTINLNKMKPIKMLTVFAIALLVFTMGCKKDDFVEVPGMCPTVITDPVNLSTSVPPNKIITATFSVNMNPATINAESFSPTGC